MQPKNILLDTYRNLIAKGIATIDGALPEIPFYSWATDESPRPIFDAAKTWNPDGPRSLAEIDALLVAFGTQLFDNWTNNPRLTESAKTTETERIVEHYTNEIDTRSNNVLDRAQRTLDILHAGGFPPRPEPRDAAQEAAIAGIKSDLMMVLAVHDSVYALVDAMTAKLKRASADNDALSIWLLSSTPWPEDYFASRRVDGAQALWAGSVASTLDKGADTGLGDVRRVYKILDGKDGFVVITQSLAALLPQIVADIAKWDPVHGSRTALTIDLQSA